MVEPPGCVRARSVSRPIRRAPSRLVASLGAGLATIALAFPLPAAAQLGCLSGTVCDPSLLSARLPACDASCASGICLGGRCLDTTECLLCLGGGATTCPELELLGADGSRLRVRGGIAEMECRYDVCPGHVLFVAAGGNGWRDPIGMECARFDPTDGFRWGDGDCDGDGIPNARDGGLCLANAALGIAAGGLSCEPSTFATSADGCAMRPGGGTVVSPDLVSCADRSGVFGICCDRQDDCPFSTGHRSRCVHLRGRDGGVAGVCTYAPEGSGPSSPEDTTCAALSDVPMDCFAAAPTSASFDYSAWATGACERSCGDDDGANAFDPFVCGCPTDAGMSTGLPDAFVPSEADASAPPPDALVAEGDAAAMQELDASVTPLDAGTAPAFGGSGCRCEAHARAPGPRVWGVGLLLLTVTVRRAVRRARR